MAERFYTVLMGDLIHSRARADRDALQQRLLGVVADLAQRLPWAAPLTVTAGDEVQGLLGPLRDDQAMAAMACLTEALLEPEAGPREVVPWSIRFGLGHGTLSTGPSDPEQLLQTSPAVLDGSCFHHARAALEIATKKKRWAVARGFLLPGETDDPATPSVYDATLDALFGLMGSLRASWTGTQARHVASFRAEQARQLKEELDEPPDRTHRDKGIRGLRRRLAELEDVSPSVITESLQGSSFEAIREAEFAVEDLLLDYERRAHGDGALA